MEARNPPESFAGWRAEIGTRKWRYGREQFRKRQGSLVTGGELRSASTCAVSTGILPMGNHDSHADEAEWKCDEPPKGGFFCFVFPTDAQPVDSIPVRQVTADRAGFRARHQSGGQGRPARSAVGRAGRDGTQCDPWSCVAIGQQNCRQPRPNASFHTETDRMRVSCSARSLLVRTLSAVIRNGEHSSGVSHSEGGRQPTSGSGRKYCG